MSNTKKNKSTCNVLSSKILKKNTKTTKIINNDDDIIVVNPEINLEINLKNNQTNEHNTHNITEKINDINIDKLELNNNTDINTDKNTDKKSKVKTQYNIKTSRTKKNQEQINIAPNEENEENEKNKDKKLNINSKNILLEQNKLEVKTKEIKPKQNPNPHYIQMTNITELNNKLTNIDQQSIINRIITDSDYAKVYLQNFEPNLDLKKLDLKGTIKILGNYNKSKKKREAYEVKVFDSLTKGTFWCSCADHKFNSAKKNIVCKHICFIVCKVLKILQTYYFETKKLSHEHLLQLLGKFDINSEIWKDSKLVRKSSKITIQDFKIFPENIIDTCTFCYDDMTNNDKQISVSCPLCNHCFHEECMGVWLESQSKCSYCSNNFWQYYKRIVGGEKEIDLGSNQL